NRNKSGYSVELIMELKALLHAVPVIQVNGSLEKDVALICFDSREVEKNSLFVAVRGVHTDGHMYIDGAISRGCTVVVVEELPKEEVKGISYILVEDTSYVLGVLAANFYQNPSKDLKLIGVTGTN